MLLAPCQVAIVASIALAMLTLSSANGSAQHPDLEAFPTYEDMLRYIAARNQRSFLRLENPTQDSYISAYNEHHERLAKRYAKRSRRATSGSSAARALPNEPTLLKFEISDAIEPSAEVKELIRQHRSREEKSAKKITKNQNAEKSSEKVLATTESAPTQKSEKGSASPRNAARTKVSRNKRPKRAALEQHQAQQAQRNFNMQIQLIPFEVADAREPDAQTMALIRRMRTLELEELKRNNLKKRDDTKAPATIVRQQRNVATQVKRAKTRPTLNKYHYQHRKLGKLFMKQKGKRVKRSLVPPQMIRFELSDARAPNMPVNSNGNLPHFYQPRRESRAVDLNESGDLQKEVEDFGKSDANAKDDQINSESKRMFIYKEAPAAIIKSKKPLSSLPHEVQKVITHLLKDSSGNAIGGGGKAYLKYLPSHMVDYRQLKTLYGAKLTATPAYGSKLTPATYVKYMQPVQKPEQLQVQIHPVPVVEKVRYIYAPVASAVSEHEGETQLAAEQHTTTQAAEAEAHYQAAHSGNEPMAQPIVVHEVGGGHGAIAPIEVHHTYTAEESAVPAPHKVAQFRPSKPDPLLNENKLNEAEGSDSDGIGAEHAPVEHYKYEIYSAPAAVAAHPHQHASSVDQLIKIEYHAPADAVKQNFKTSPEFKQLSTLVGKSPEDQIHGLTYLLAKEMQSKLQLQREHKQLKEKHASTAPIVFPPEAQYAQQMPQQQKYHFGVQSGRLIGMAKSKEYIPIVESAAVSSGEQKATGEGKNGVEGAGGAEHLKMQHHVPPEKQFISFKVEPKAPTPNSFVEYGLSPNYEHVKGGNSDGAAAHTGGHKAKLLYEQVIHHPTVTHHGGLGETGGKIELDHSGSKLLKGAKSAESGKEAAAAGDVAHNIDFDLQEANGLQYASKYAFGYRIRDFYTGNDFGHKQNRDLDGVTRGQYHILLPDGRIQNVIYHADDTGFHADVSFDTGH